MTTPAVAHDRSAAGARLPLEHLLLRGHVVLRAAISSATVTALNAELTPRFEATPFCEGDFYGWKTKRFGQLLRRSPTAQDLVLHPEALAVCEAVLKPWCDVITLNLTQALELHPGQPAQYPHRDNDMWPGTGRDGIECLVNVMWPLTPYREDNGGTRIHTASHGRLARHAVDPSGWTTPELEPGDALIFLGSTLHGGGANRSQGIRRGIIVSYCLGWLLPFENPWLAYPPEVAREFPKALQDLIGYRQHRPNLGNYDGQCPSILLGEQPVPDVLAARDALRPEQAAGLRALAGQNPSA